MNRRLFIQASAGLAASGWLGHVPTTPTRHAAPPIAIFDPSLVQSVQWAGAVAHDGARVIACGDDVAALWYALLSRVDAPIVGALRPSDFFVLKHLMQSSGRDMTRGAASGRVVFFRMSARSN
jgi:hypothetical protein